MLQALKLSAHFFYSKDHNIHYVAELEANWTASDSLLKLASQMAICYVAYVFDSLPGSQTDKEKAPQARRNTFRNWNFLLMLHAAYN